MTLPTQQYVFRGVVQRVVDGDTLLIQLDQGLHTYRTEKLRLLRVNAPEMHGLSAPAGEAAKQYTAQWLADPNVIVQTYLSDSFGRFLAEVYRTSDGANLSDDLLSSGNAVAFVK